MKIVIASSNKNKIIEIRDKFSSIAGMEIVSLSEYKDIPEIVEDADTFSGNALKKAVIIRDFTGEISLADDSGLVVDALNGEPGVYSARYGGDNLSDIDRYKLVLEKMAGVEDGRRTARFVCAIAMALPDGREFVVEGSCEGVISREPSGSNGFGYDPVFYIPELKAAMAEITLAEKNRISHRAKALEAAYEIFSGMNYAR
ncbi:MAG: non-canonical purine NTP pyrophosphatase [Spirochaetae bacterium HGW-Spirochaetae-5]|nr:MAG: non-canonical purine NTP pyrophosphatase [Spirochaetae bacterium HGW-Spirochaetae-5]